MLSYDQLRQRIKYLYFVICVLLSLLSGVIGAWVARSAENSWATCFFTGGGIFAGTLTLFVGVLTLLWNV